jgi:hypothetical protein
MAWFGRLMPMARHDLFQGHIEINISYHQRFDKNTGRDLFSKPRALRPRGYILNLFFGA